MKFAHLPISIKSMDRSTAAIIAIGMTARAAFAAISWSGDWDALAGMGRAAYYSPGSFFGIYTVPAYVYSAFYAVWSALPISHSFLSYNFAMKTPGLIFDFLTAIMIYVALKEIGVGRGQVNWAVGAWLLNPLTIIAGFFNYLEVIPAFLLLLASYLAGKERKLAASTSLTIAALFRVVPLIAFPFFLATTVRSRDWRGVVKIVAPLLFLLAGAMALIEVVTPGTLAVIASGSGVGLLRPEAYDVLGVKLSTNTVIYPGSTVAMTALVYILLLAVVVWVPKTDLWGTRVLAEEFYLPILAYLAFSFSSPPFLMYGIPFLLVQFATRRHYRGLMVLFSVVGSLWCLVRSPNYLIQPVSTIFYIPYYTQYWSLQKAAEVWLNNALTIQSYLGTQITAAFTAFILFTMAVMLQPTWISLRGGAGKPHSVDEGGRVGAR